MWMSASIQEVCRRISLLVSSIRDTGQHQTHFAMRFLRSQTSSRAVRVLPVPISMNKAPTLSRESFSIAAR